MSNDTQHSLAMITAWMTASTELMDAAIPPAPTIARLKATSARPNETIVGIVNDYETMRMVAVELSLLCATALTCWANSMGLDPEIVLRDIALNVKQQSSELD